MRSDARDNRERILRVAKAALAEQGSGASLNKIAQGAGVGPGTLYRHFPTMESLLVSIIRDDVDALCALGHELLASPRPDEGLRKWLHAVAVHATGMRGLVASHMLPTPATHRDRALAECHEQLRATGAALLARARPDDSPNADARIRDLLIMVNALAWASEQVPDDTELLDRLLRLATGSSH